MEDFLIRAIEQDAQLLIALDGREPATWMFQTSAVGEGENPDIPDRPYIVWNEGVAVPQAAVKESSNAQWRTFTFYIYDDSGDFGRINAIMRHLRRIVKAVAPFTTEDGTRCSASEWVGISGLIQDQGYHLITRFGTARFMVSQ